MRPWNGAVTEEPLLEANAIEAERSREPDLSLISTLIRQLSIFKNDHVPTDDS